LVVVGAPCAAGLLVVLGAAAVGPGLRARPEIEKPPTEWTVKRYTPGRSVP